MMLEPNQKLSPDEPDSDSLPVASPRSVVQTLKDLPRQCLKIFTRPKVSTLAKEGENASWGRICILLLLLAVIELTSTLLTNETSASPLHGLPFLRSSFIDLIVVWCTFFLEMCLTYLLARLFRGSGTFLVQCYLLLISWVLTNLLLTIVSYITVLVPLPFLLFIALNFIVLSYGGNVVVRAIMATHNLSWGKAFIILLLIGLTILLLNLLPGGIFHL